MIPLEVRSQAQQLSANPHVRENVQLLKFYLRKVLDPSLKMLYHIAEDKIKSEKSKALVIEYCEQLQVLLESALKVAELHASANNDQIKVLLDTAVPQIKSSEGLAEVSKGSCVEKRR